MTSATINGMCAAPMPLGSISHGVAFTDADFVSSGLRRESNAEVNSEDSTKDTDEDRLDSDDERMAICRVKADGHLWNHGVTSTNKAAPRKHRALPDSVEMYLERPTVNLDAATGLQVRVDRAGNHDACCKVSKEADFCKSLSSTGVADGCPDRIGAGVSYKGGENDNAPLLGAEGSELCLAGASATPPNLRLTLDADAEGTSCAVQ